MAWWFLFHICFHAIVVDGASDLHPGWLPKPRFKLPKQRRSKDLKQKAWLHHDVQSKFIPINYMVSVE